MSKKMIRIVAESKFFSCDITIPDEDSLEALQNIRDNYQKFRKTHWGDEDCKEPLKVETSIVEPKPEKVA